MITRVAINSSASVGAGEGALVPSLLSSCTVFCVGSFVGEYVGCVGASVGEENSSLLRFWFESSSSVGLGVGELVGESVGL